MLHTARAPTEVLASGSIIAMRLLLPALMFAAVPMVMSCAAPAPTAPAPFAEVDQRTSPFFIALEDTSLVESQGAERVYNLGLNACSAFDRGETVAKRWASLAAESRLPVGEAGDLLVASVQHLCPQHRPAMQAFADRGADADAELAREACAIDPEFDRFSCN